jgi:hypothetical protein
MFDAGSAFSYRIQARLSPLDARQILEGDDMAFQDLAARYRAAR